MQFPSVIVNLGNLELVSVETMLVSLRFSSLSDRVDASLNLGVDACLCRRVDVLTQMFTARLFRIAT